MNQHNHPEKGYAAPLMPLPADLGQHPGVVAACRALDTELSQLDRDRAASILDWIRSDPVSIGRCHPLREEELEHELSPYISAASTEERQPLRSLRELGALRLCGLPSPSSISTYGHFHDTLSKLGRAIVGDSRGFRRGEISSQPDANGSFIIFPDAAKIEEQMLRIFEFWTTFRESNPAFCGLVTMTALMNLHPFEDGNGRVGRTIFNWTACHHLREEVYVPIYEMSAFSRGGYLIRLRLAQYFSDWLPLAEFVLNGLTRLVQQEMAATIE